MEALDQTDLVALALSFGVPLLSGLLIIGVIVLYVRRPDLPPLLGPGGVVRLSGQLTPASTWMSFSRETFGSVEVTDHELIWRSLAGPEWRIPIPYLLLLPSGVFGRHPGIVFEAPWAGRWKLQVSDGPLSPFVTDIGRKVRRQRAEELRYVLASRGARIVAH